MSKNENKKATNLTEYFKENIDDIVKYLVELYEFQENIQIDYKLIKNIKGE